MTELNLTLLGGLGVTQNGSAVPGFGTRKAMALFCYLVIGRKPYSRTTLAGLLWSDKPESNARMNLRRTLFRLRPVSSYLHITPSEIGFSHAQPYHLDVESFEQAVARSKTDNQSDTQSLRYAVSLYKGDFLDGFHVRNAPVFEDWAMGQRARLRDLAVQSLHKLVVDCSDKGELIAGIEYAKLLLAQDPWREDGHRQLMALLARSGQRSAALMQYEACRRILSEELGVVPTPATRDLHERILLNQFDAFLPDGVEEVIEVQVVDDSAESVKSRSEAVLPAHNLQFPLTPLLGRENELVLLEELLHDPYVRAVTILGSGGIGKTRMALGVAEAQLKAGNFVDGVFFVGLARLNSADEILPAIADSLNDNFSRLDQLLNYVRNKNMLLILDNFEHVMAGVTLVEELLRASPNSQIIVTSREKLSRQWEYLFPLGGLSYPQLNRYEEFSAESQHTQYDAVQLFLTCARRVRPTFDVTASLEHVLRICNLIEGMPLGIILAATWLEVLRPAEVAAEIQRGLDFLESEMGDIPRRQRSLRATFAYSWRLLSQTERDIFKQLSVFQGGFTREAAQEVTGATLHDLRALVGKSLIYTELDGRYQIHELLRQFSAERLANNAAVQNATRDRHAAYFCAKVGAWLARVKGSEHKQVMALFDVEINNAQVAWRWAIKRKNSMWVHQAVEGLSLYFQWRARYETFIDDVREAETVFSEQLTTVTDMLLLARIRTCTGKHASVNRSDGKILKDNLVWLKDDVFAGVDTRRIESDCWFYLLRSLGSRQARTEALTHCIMLAEQAEDRWRLALFSLAYATESLWSADFTSAAQQLHANRAIVDEVGDPFLIMFHWRDEAQVLNFMAPIEEMASVELACQRYIDIQDDLGASNYPPPIMLILTLCAQGKFRQASDRIDAGIAIMRERNDYDFMARALYSISSVHYDEESIARSLLDDLSLRIGPAPSNTEKGLMAVVRGRLALVAGDREIALGYFKQALEKFRIAENRSNSIWFSADLALAARTREALHDAIDGILSSKAYALVHWLLPAVALTLLEEGDVERAIELYALAETYPAIAKSRWYVKVAGNEIADSAEKLPTHIVEAAQERGQKLDTMTTLNQLRSELASNS